MKIIHIITDLGEGGAQKFLINLCQSTSELHNHIIISLSSSNQYLLNQKYNFKIYTLNLNKFLFGFFGSIVKLIRIIKRNKPNIIQTWLYHADFIGGIIAFIFGYRRIFWTVRDCSIDVNTKLLTKLIVIILSKLSYIIPEKIIFNSNNALNKFNKRYGYDKEKSFLIQNGFDIKKYKINKKDRKSLRNFLGLNEIDLVLGMVARFHPVKNHIYLIKTLNLVKRKFPNIKCLLVGKDLDKNNLFLKKIIKDNQIEENIVLLGIRRDITKIMNTIDIHLLSSKSEAFPNVIGEAMACGTPCVSTNVGDVQDIIGNNGWIVPINDYFTFSETIILAINEINCKNKKTNPNIIRKRIIDYFSQEKMVKNFLEIWQ